MNKTDKKKNNLPSAKKKLKVCIKPKIKQTSYCSSLQNHQYFLSKTQNTLPVKIQQKYKEIQAKA